MKKFGRVHLLCCRCGRCGHEWLPRERKERTLCCPTCKSTYWDKPRKLKRRKKD